VAQYILKGGKEVKSKNRFVIYGIILFASLLLSPLSPRLNIVSIVATATSGSAQDIQSAINQVAGQGGGEVYIPAGTHDFATGSWQTVNIPSGVSIFGAPTQRDVDGQVISWNTILKMPFRAPRYEKFFNIENADNVRISDIQLVGYREISTWSIDQQKDVEVWTGVSIRHSNNFRVDHCYFKNICGQGVFTENSNGVIDHNQFVNDKNVRVHPYYNECTVHYGVATNGERTATWETDIQDVLGKATYRTVFVEDNYFEGWRHVVASSMLGHYVFRYNTERKNGYGSIDAHGKEGAQTWEGTRAIEVYENDFGDAIWGRAGSFHRGGGGVYFNNIVDSTYGYRDIGNPPYAPTDYCAFVSMIQKGVWATYPDPKTYVKDVWIWDNTVAGGGLVYSAAGGNIDLNEEFFLREPDIALDGFTYTPYTYPHPLVSGSEPTEGYWSVDIVATPTEGGTTSPAGLQNVLVGDSLTVTALPNSNYSLSYWAFDGANYGDTLTVTIPAQTENSVHTLKAVFGYSANEPPPTTPTTPTTPTPTTNLFYMPFLALGFIFTVEVIYRWKKQG